MIILIVDDNTNDRKLLRMILERHGCGTVIEARDGQEGLELAREHRPDLIVSDAMMPRLDGFAFMRAVKLDPVLKSIPFVFHSSVYTGSRDEELATRLGAEAFIAKPKEPEEFWSEISAVLSRIAAGATPTSFDPMAEEQEYLREYSGVVAAKLEEKVQELEESLARQKEAEEALRKSERFLQNIIENIPNMIFVKDAGELRYLLFNRAGEELLGFSRDECRGKNDYDFFPAAEADLRSERDRKILGSGTVVDISEETVRTRDDRERILHTKKIPVPDAAGVPQYLLGISEDITEVKKLEEQLRHAQKMEAVGTLAAGIAHDFNNILTAIIGFGSILDMKMAEDDPLHVNVTQILAAGERAANLTRSLLAFGRSQPVETRLVDLNEVVTGVSRMLRRLLREDVEMAVRLFPEPLPVLADAGQIEQVLLNLTTNARDAMGKNGAIAVATELVELEGEFRTAHGYGRPGSYALLRFTDNGQGMDEQTVQRIFEPFFTTKEVGKGTGLGLSICYSIVKQHGGYLSCSSTPGRGTTFSIHLPLSDEAAARPEPAQAVPGRCGTETILVAEDDPVVRALTVSVLTEFGYRVLQAQDGEEAVARFRELGGEIALCLLDVIMPKKGGWEAYQEIKEIDPLARALMMSGYQADRTLSQSLSREGAGFLSKPVAPRELLKKVRDLLDTP